MWLWMWTISAVAGPLADGFLGIPYGDATKLADKPIPSCVDPGSDGAFWVCEHKIGTAPVKVHFQKVEGLYVGVSITAESFRACTELIATLQAAYGPGRVKHDFEAGETLADRSWSDGDVLAGFENNDYTDKCRFVVFSKSIHLKGQAIKESRAKGAVDSLLGPSSSPAPAAPAPVAPTFTGTLCNDGTVSPSCATCGQGCCSGHGGCK